MATKQPKRARTAGLQKRKKKDKNTGPGIGAGYRDRESVVSREKPMHDPLIRAVVSMVLASHDASEPACGARVEKLEIWPNCRIEDTCAQRSVGLN